MKNRIVVIIGILAATIMGRASLTCEITEIAANSLLLDGVEKSTGVDLSIPIPDGALIEDNGATTLFIVKIKDGTTVKGVFDFVIVDGIPDLWTACKQSGSSTGKANSVSFDTSGNGNVQIELTEGTTTFNFFLIGYMGEN